MGNSIWTNEEVRNIVDDHEIRIIKLDRVEDKESLLDLALDKSSYEILEMIKHSPVLINDHGGYYDLRDGHMLYIMDNGMIGFGIRGQVHAINQVRLHKDSNKIFVSRMSIAGIVVTQDRNIKTVRDYIANLNLNEYACCRVRTIVYFAD